MPSAGDECFPGFCQHGAIRAGGESPAAFLKKSGVGLGMRDMTAEGSKAAQQAALSKNEFASAQVEVSSEA